MFRKAAHFLSLTLTAALLVGIWPAPLHAQRGRGRGGPGPGRSVIIVGGFYDPFWAPYWGSMWGGPWGPWGPYGYPAYYPVAYSVESSVRVMVEPRDAQVYVDGYYAGIVDDFDGFFQRLRVAPGEHEITLFQAGFRTVHQKLYLTPHSTYKLQYTMEPLGPGEVSEPAPTAPPPQAQMPQPGGPRQPGPPPMPPRGPRGRMPPPPPGGDQGDRSLSDFGTLAIRVQPGDAEVLIDGESWRGPEGPGGAGVSGGPRLIVQVSEGPHRVEMRKEGFQPFVTEVRVTRGETTTLNVSLPPAGRN